MSGIDWELYWAEDREQELVRAETERELRRQEEQIRHEADVRRRR